MTELKVIPDSGKHRPQTEVLSYGIRAGDVLWLSGQTSRDMDTGEAVKGDIELQTNKVIDNIEAVLKQEGVGLERVERCTVFVTCATDLEGMNKVYVHRFKEPRPARAAYIVAGLANSAYRIELDAIAIAGSGPANG
jgi:2-iminobutanoate/2-iminopropanoate deaminase